MLYGNIASLYPLLHALHPGTFSHMAPEVMRGKYDLSADLFSFGIVITEALLCEEAT